MSSVSDFWSRRRSAVLAEAEAEARSARARAEAEERARLEAKSDAELLAELELPDPDTLAPGDDVSRFMGAIVPERLRRRALRRLWRVNPVLANVDGLVDYGEDFTEAATVAEALHGAWQVGKGVADRLGPNGTANGTASGAGTPATPATGARTVAADAGAAAPEDGAALPPDAADEADAAGRGAGNAAPEDAPARAVARRMRFELEG